MATLKFGTLGEEISPDQFGYKAHRIEWLYNQGYQVPSSVFIGVLTQDELSLLDENINKIEDMLSDFKNDSGYYNIAIRSSATNEDLEGQSKAGHYDSYLGNFTLDEVLNRVKSVISGLSDEEIDKMGVIIQEKIDSKFSGVAFSSDPVSGDKSNLILSVVSGEGEKLVAGEKTGEDIRVSLEAGSLDIPDYTAEIDTDLVTSLSDKVLEIEEVLNEPVDVEWCVDNQGSVYFLQVRPDASLTGTDNTVMELTPDVLEKLPQFASTKTQLRNRIEAKNEGVNMSNAYVCTITCHGSNANIPDISSIDSTNPRQNYTVMLLHPDKIRNDQKYDQLPERMRTEEFIETCDRYCVRSYPARDSLSEDISEIANLCCKEYWIAVILIQEIFSPSYSGIIQKIDDGYLVEIGRGALVTKGMFSVSRYIIDENLKVIESTEAKQSQEYEIVDGYVLLNDLGTDDKEVSLPEDTLSNVVEELKPVLEFKGDTVEFGIKETKGNFEPYLIDFLETDSGGSVVSTPGVVSHGKASGKVLKMDMTNLSSNPEEYIENIEIEDGQYILYCETPDIMISDILHSYEDSIAGFVFEEGSILSHLSVLLREKDIPAVIKSGESIHENSRITIDSKNEIGDMISTNKS